MSARDIGAIKARAVPIRRAAQQRSGKHGEAVDQEQLFRPHSMGTLLELMHVGVPEHSIQIFRVGFVRDPIARL